MICDGTDVRRIEMPPELEAVLVIPHSAGAYRGGARGAAAAGADWATPSTTSHTIARLTPGLATADWDLIAAGLGDRLHQPYRAHLYPRSAELVERAADYGALGATISGAGPTVLIWCRRSEPRDALIAVAPGSHQRLGRGHNACSSSRSERASRRSERRYARRAFRFLRASCSPRRLSSSLATSR